MIKMEIMMYGFIVLRNKNMRNVYDDKGNKG